MLGKFFLYCSFNSFHGLWFYTKRLYLKFMFPMKSAYTILLILLCRNFIAVLRFHITCNARGVRVVIRVPRAIGCLPSFLVNVEYWVNILVKFKFPETFEYIIKILHYFYRLGIIKKIRSLPFLKLIEDALKLISHNLKEL